MLKEIALVALRANVDEFALLDRINDAADRTVPAPAGVLRRLLSRVLTSSDPAAVGAVPGFQLVAETWFSDDALPRVSGATWFETLAPEAAALVDREASIAFVAREVVLKEPQPAGYKIVSLLKRNRDKDFQQFLRYWHLEHGAIVESVPEFWRHILGYVQNHPVHEGARTLAGAKVSGFDGVTQLWFADDAAAVRAFSEPRYLEVVRPDEVVLRSGAPMRMLVEEILVQVEG